MKYCLPFIAALALSASSVAEETFTLENDSLARIISVDHGILRTTQIDNKRAHVTETPAAAPEFQLRISGGAKGPAVVLTAPDFHVVAANLATNAATKTLAVTLTNLDRKLGVEVVYELKNDDFFMRKHLNLVSEDSIVLERVDVEAFNLKDAYQPYTLREITSRAPGRWNPGLGQPLYTSKSGTFWGIEFPAADNHVANGLLEAGYLWGRAIASAGRYQSYNAVMGVTDDPQYITDTFFEYIDRIRARPLRLRIQYNSWFDYGGGVNEEKFSNSIAKVNQELVVARHNPPLDAYTIDDGWEDAKTNWSDKIWKVNEKFDPDFASSLQAVKNANSKLGLWLSPGCLFNARSEIPLLRDQGFEALSNSMSMAGPRYTEALENRLAELTLEGVNFFKFDGIFGHLNTRDFDLNGRSYGVVAMPEFTGLGPSDTRLNDPMYDDAKIYYLSAGTERLIRIFQKLGKIDPNIHIVISNGAYLSPWWLMYVDDVWMINAGDAAQGAGRGPQLVYRDGRYYDIWRTKNIQYPMCSVFNHEPKKVDSNESPEDFRNYLFMSLSRGTGFIELYLKPSRLEARDWDVLGEGLRWAREQFPAFSRVRMHGGNPQANEVYGYIAWSRTNGYLSVHNPSDKPQEYRIKLDRSTGMFPGKQSFFVDSPLKDSPDLPKTVTFDDSLTLQLAPGEIRIVDFSDHPAGQK